jgi:7,8-dihydroneopterin aldolase/epimerase/oxygenase
MAIKGTVSLEGIEFFAHHGLYDFERTNGNTFIVDVYMTSHYEAKELYSLDTTIDYETVHAFVDAVMQEPEDLLETVAHKIMEVILAGFADIEHLKIKIRKSNPPIKNAKLSHSAFELEWVK